MLVIAAAAIGCPKRDSGPLAVMLNNWAKKKKVELDITFYPTGDAFPDCHAYDYHILFIDISPDEGEDRLAAAYAVRKSGLRIPIVLISYNKKFLMEGYRINALSYLIKPYKDIEIESCMEHIFEVASDANFMLRTKGTTFCIPYHNILYIRGIDDEVLIAMKEGSFQTHLPLCGLDYALPGQFIRCTTHTIVNIKYVYLIEKNGLVLLNGEQLEIYPSYWQSVVSVYINS